MPSLPYISLRPFCTSGREVELPTWSLKGWKERAASVLPLSWLSSTRRQASQRPAYSPAKSQARFPASHSSCLLSFFDARHVRVQLRGRVTSTSASCPRPQRLLDRPSLVLGTYPADFGRARAARDLRYLGTACFLTIALSRRGAVRIPSKSYPYARSK